jgi:hypothetical protein
MINKLLSVLHQAANESDASGREPGNKISISEIAATATRRSLQRRNGLLATRNRGATYSRRGEAAYYLLVDPAAADCSPGRREIWIY